MRKQNRKFARIIVALLIASMILCMLPTLSFAESEPQTREYNEAFDRLLDAGAGVGSQKAYRSISWAAGQCDDVTDPIFKVGSPKISAGFESLNIELRSPDGSIKLEDLKIGLRTADSDENATTNSYVLSDEDIIGGITFSAGEDIGTEFAVMSIDFASTEVKVGGKAFDSTAPDAMLAFHLYTADNTVAGKLDIRKVSVTTGSNETVVLDFDSINEAWWNGGEAGTFINIPKHYAVTDKISIASDDASHNNLDEKYGAIVLNIAGENATVAPILEDGSVGAAKAWSELKDLAGTPVAALDGNFRNAVISLESLGAKKIKGVEISGNALVAGAFFTNMDTIQPDKHFPVLDTESITYMSQFNFEYLTAGPDYDKAVTDSAAFNCDYILSYSTKNNVIKDGHLVLDAQGEAFTSIKIRSKVASEGRQYLVIKYKLENGATLNDFRFDVLKTEGDTGVGIKYANELLAGRGLPSLSEANPYLATNGYNYLVIDLEKTFGERYISGVDMYISGEGQVLIDEIFYAHPAVEKGEYSENVLAAPQEIVVNDADGGYQYLGWIGLDGQKHDGIEIVMRAEGNATLNDVRFEMGGKVTWFADNAEGTFVDSYGRKMPALTAENQVYYIDLAASGITGALNEIHVHGAPVVGGGKIIIESIRYCDYPDAPLEIGEEVLAGDFPGKEMVAGGAGYAYVGWMNGSLGNGYDYLILEVEGDISQLRIAFEGIGTFWGSENAEGTLRDRDGNLFATSGKQTLVIDLEKSGIVGAFGNVHFHNTFAAEGDVLKITSAKFAKEPEAELAKSGEALADDFPGREVTAGGAGYAYVGWMDASVGNGYDYLILEVEGDISQLRIAFEGIGTFWGSENAEGTLRDRDGNLFATSGKQTLVIDLEKSGIVGTMGNVHMHNTFAAEGDVLKITSAIFAKELIGYENIVLPENDDCAPTISHGIAGTANIGDEIALSATATDNYGGDVTIRYEVTFGTEAVEVSEGKFVPSKVGTYSVKIIASDGINEREEVVSVVVTCEHGDADVDYICDKCGAELERPEPPVCEEHKDEDGDEKCDACGADVPKSEPPVEEPPVDEPPVDEPTHENPIIAWFIKIFNMIIDWFKNLFAGPKK